MQEKTPHRPLLIHRNTRKPVKIHLEASIALETRDYWIERIERYGGKVVENDFNADVVFINNTEDRCTRQLAYAANSDARKRKISVQHLAFLKNAIRYGTWTMPGQLKDTRSTTTTRRGNRTEYTRKDDENLARYFAAILPDRAFGGRTGDNPYKYLCELGETDEDFAWAKRHTWQSWRNRYKASKRKFDSLIESFVPTINPKRENRWQDAKRARQVYVTDEEEYSEDEVDENETEQEHDEGEGEGEERANRKRANRNESRSAKRRRTSDSVEDSNEDRRGRGGSSAGEHRSPPASDHEHPSAEPGDWEEQYTAGVFDNPGDPNGGLPAPQRLTRHSVDPSLKMAKNSARRGQSEVDAVAEEEESSSTSEEDVSHSLFSDDGGESDEAPSFEDREPASGISVTEVAPQVSKGPLDRDAPLQAFRSEGSARRSLQPSSMVPTMAAKKLQSESTRNVRASSHRDASTSAKGKRPWKTTQTPIIDANLRARAAASSSNETPESVPVAEARAKAYKRR